MIAFLAAAMTRHLESMPEAGAEIGTAPKFWRQRSHYGRSGPLLTGYTVAVLGRFVVTVNRIRSADEEEEFHSHPWRAGASVVLAGGYREYRLAADGVRERDVRPGDFNVVLGTTFHRVELLPEGREAWTLMITTPERGAWGFVDPRSYLPWERFFARRGAGS